MSLPARRPVWREPVAWLAAALPLAVIVAALATIAIARVAPADASDSHTRRIAQIQLEDLAPDREAARRGLAARLDADPARGAIALAFETGAVDDGVLELAMLHPLDASKDRHLSVRRDGTAWRASTAPWPVQAWELRVVSSRGDWRLAGRLAAGARGARLEPAVSP